MNKLKNININDLGFIENSVINGFACNSPVYIVLFCDYTRINPFCSQLDITEKIKDVTTGEDYIEYIKEVESFKLLCRITANDTGWVWNIKISESYPLNHRFGVAMPWVHGETTSLDKKITTPVSQYSTSLQQIYNDQSLLLMPILTRNNEQNHSIFGPLNQDHHFFLYEDGDVPYCRTTSSTTRFNEFTICYKVHNNSSASSYVEEYPEAENMIYVWKPTLKRIGARQGVEITYQHTSDVIERPKTQIYVFTPTNAQLDRFSNHLKLALGKYPDKFLNQMGVSAILLSGKIIVKTDNVSRNTGAAFGEGCTSQRWIFLDISQNDMSVIHHEIFHYISEHIDMNNLPDIVGDSKIEFYANLFGELMINPHKEDVNSESLCKEVLKYCADIKFSKQYSDSDTQIWAIQNDSSQQIVFGDTPSENCDYVSDIAWQKEWHENNTNR